MRLASRVCRDEWLPNYYPSRPVGPESHVRISRTGKPIVLNGHEDRQLSEVFMDRELFERLQRTGHILTRENAARVFDELRTWHAPVYAGPSLHIVVLTRRCNLDCTYCHMNPVSAAADPRANDMQPAVADAIIDFALASPNQVLTFEFQGGEPFLNFATLKHFVESTNKRNVAAGKTVSFAIVSNLLMLTSEHIEFCRANNVSISYTLNGPEDIHDRFRITRSKRGTFKIVRRRARELAARHPDVISTAPLCVLDEWAASHLERIIDFYIDEGFDGLSIIPLKRLGSARARHAPLDHQAYMRCYLRALDYIADQMDASPTRNFTERMVPYAVRKIVGGSNGGLVDWRNPAGDASGSLTYDVDGEILPLDESRSLRNEFSLGNVTRTTYAELVARRETFRTMNLSLRDRDSTCRECAFNPYCGVVPVLEFARTGSAVPVPLESEECLFTLGLVDWVFQNMLRRPIAVFRMAGLTPSDLVGLMEQTGCTA